MAGLLAAVVRLPHCVHSSCSKSHALAAISWQVLDTVFVGPVAPGQYRFVFQVRAHGRAAAPCLPGRSSAAGTRQRLQLAGHVTWELARSYTLPSRHAHLLASRRTRHSSAASRTNRKRCPPNAVLIGLPRCDPFSKYCLQADPPEFSRIPPDDIVGVTVILLTCSYREKVGQLGRNKLQFGICVQTCVEHTGLLARISKEKVGQLCGGGRRRPRACCWLSLARLSRGLESNCSHGMLLSTARKLLARPVSPHQFGRVGCCVNSGTPSPSCSDWLLREQQALLPAC